MPEPFPKDSLTPESWYTRSQRWYISLFPAFWGSGARVTHVAQDWSEIRVKLSLGWRNRNLVGTLFGGSLYCCVDPFYMIQLMRRLGPEFIVWDKSAHIRFLKPGRSTLYTRFLMDDEEIATVRRELQSQRSVDRHYTCELVDDEGVVHATVEKCVYVRKKLNS